MCEKTPWTAQCSIRVRDSLPSLTPHVSISCPGTNESGDMRHLRLAEEGVDCLLCYQKQDLDLGKRAGRGDTAMNNGWVGESFPVWDIFKGRRGPAHRG